MFETPEVKELPRRLRAYIPVQVPRADIQRAMGQGIHELFDAVAAQGVAITGPWFTHHLRMAPDAFDFEISVPVASPVTAAGRMLPGEWPAMRAACAVHRGGYEGLGAAWGDFMAWISAQGLEPAGDLWESYTVGPESGPDASAWRTELVRPLKGR